MPRLSLPIKVVEVDETYIGGVAHGGKRGRGTENKVIVVIAVELPESEAKNQLGRVVTGTIRYQYDAGGRLVRQTDDGAGESTVYAYDAARNRKRMISGSITKYEYNALGRKPCAPTAPHQTGRTTPKAAA